MQDALRTRQNKGTVRPSYYCPDVCDAQNIRFSLHQTKWERQHYWKVICWSFEGLPQQFMLQWPLLLIRLHRETMPLRIAVACAMMYHLMPKRHLPEWREEGKRASNKDLDNTMPAIVTAFTWSHCKVTDDIWKSFVENTFRSNTMV